MRGGGFEFRILGPIEVRCHGAPVTVRAPKLRILLAALLLDAGRVVTVETLMERLWGDDPPDGARNTLQNYVLRLRRLLGGPAEHVPLVTRPQGYLIEPAPGALDLHRFDALVSRARAAATAGEMEQASALLEEALPLWRGEALSDVPSEVLRRDVVPVLNERRLDAIELRVDADLALGRHESLVAELHELTTAHPLRERFWAQRMVALYRSGRQGDGLRCYRTVRDLLAEELGVDPGVELRELHQRLLAADPALLHTRRPADRGNLPAEVTTFIGREPQLAEIGRLLADNRLVTLTGVGGVGKTRLALRAGAELRGRFPDGVWLADLTSLAEPQLLDQIVAEALGIRDQSARSRTDILVAQLRAKRLLLVLDNCEHVVGAVAALVDVLLKTCPGLRVLTTSRHRLGLQSEHPLLVPPLALPPAAASTGRAAARPLTCYDAVALLAARAAASAPDFRVGPDNEKSVAQLCRRLDGIPLAIELAAVRLSALSVEEILDRLDHRSQLLVNSNPHITPRHHQTLRDVIDWSHGLCTEAERLLWAQLSVFSGGFDLEAAEAVCSGPGIARDDVANLLAGLVHKSILIVSARGPRTRYRLLETIRQYGRRRLVDLGLHPALHRRHRDHYQRMAARAAIDWCGPGEVEWLSRLRRELPNLRAALTFCLTRQGQAVNGLEIAVNLTRTRIWFFSSTIGEGRLWLERAYQAASVLPGPGHEAAAAFLVWIALCQGDQAAAEGFLARCRDPRVRPSGGGLSPVAAYIEGAHAMLVHGSGRAIRLLARARDLFRRAGARGDAHMATMMWAMACAFLGDRDTAVAASEEYLAEAEACGGAWAGSWALWTRGLTELRHGDAGRSVGLFREALRRQYDIDDRWGPVWGLESLAWATAATGDHPRAAELLGSAYGLRQATGVALIGLRPFHDAHAVAERRTRRALGAEAYEAAFERGRPAGARGDRPQPGSW
ncbi:BTAD domain-containing putative transcriptional regulator [Nonomuraea sp. NPDC048916]|uniref:BTAD domain-containing putative transcriptional regulator n=1 Tax=Nonomuraea sp. NPDC048916 TaxID=3154232 RepID=UPI003410D222